MKYEASKICRRDRFPGLVLSASSTWCIGRDWSEVTCAHRRLMLQLA